MKVEWVPFGELFQMERQPVTIEPTAEYRKIGILSWGKGMIRYPACAGTEMGAMKYFTFPTPSLIFSNIQAWEGAVALAEPVDESRVCSSRFYPYVPREKSLANLYFFGQFFRSAAGQELMRRCSPGTQVRNKLLSRAKLESALVPLPSLAEQTRVAEHLRSLRPPLRSEPPRGLALPDGVRVRVGDLLQARVRTTPVAHDEIYPMFGVKWYGDGAFIREVLPGTEISAANVRRIESGDLIYNRLFAWKQSFALASRDGYSSNEFPAFEVDASQVSPRVLLALLTSDEFTEQVNAASTGSTPTSRNRLKEERFLNLTVDLPFKSAQPAIERALFAMDKARKLHSRRDELAAAVLPAARNEIFNAMR